MKQSNLTLLLVALLMIGGTAFGINRLRSHQKLTPPGIIAKEIPGSRRMELYLPETLLNYKSSAIPLEQVLNGLPPDTSAVQRQYLRGPAHRLWDSDTLFMTVVMMGTDRTSIHKPQFCLRGQGWDIDGGNSSFDTVRVESPHPYDLPVMKIMNTRQIVDSDGQQKTLRGIYVYWFVADNDLTADHWTRMKRMATHLLRTGELERWAYVSCLGICLPGEEDATYARMKKFIAAAVPQFQKATNPPIAEHETARTASR